MQQPQKRRGNLKRSTHQRGDKRRRQLIEAATRLVDTMPVAKIRLSDVAREAGIPLASARHFYKNKHEMLLAIMGASYPDWFDVLENHARSVDPQTWPELSDALIDATLIFWAKYPVIAKILRGSITGELARAEIRADKKYSAPFIHSLFDAFFEMPQIPDDAPDIFLIFTKLVDQVFSIGLSDYGEVTPRITEEVKSLARAYLSLYLPQNLPRSKSPAKIVAPKFQLRLDSFIEVQAKDSN